MPNDQIPQETDFLVFEPFVRTQFPVLICLFGFSGCGKTKSALLIARGLGGKTMFMDTETGRGRVYAEDAEGFGYTEMTPPFTPERYMAAIKQIEAAGYDNLVIDSGSHEWDGLGGMLEIADGNVKKDGSKMTGLGKWSVKSRHKSFMNTMMAGRMNIIICLRAKDKFTEKFVGDRKEIVMEGFVPLQERNFKYDMMIQLPMPEDGEGRFMMDRTKGFKCPGALLPFFKPDAQITSEIGKAISSWIATGKPVDELLRQLRIEAAAEADNGVDHFRAYWAKLPKEKRMQLTPYLANFESAAKAADIEKSTDDDFSPTSIDPHRKFIGGSDIRSLTGKGPLEIALETHRRSEDADWWAVIDDLAPKLNACGNMDGVVAFADDHDKQLKAFGVAPGHIKAHWQAILDRKQKGMTAAKAA